MTTLQNFIDYCQTHLKGDEKGESQIFLDRLFVALGYADGLRGAGATCEFRIRNEQKRSTSFGDLVWKKRVLIEMKKRGEDLSIHLQQATSYWLQLAGDRPRYVMLCNFDEFWIYDFEKSIYEPAAKIALPDLAKQEAALGFLLPTPTKPLFNADFQDVTQEAARQVAQLFRSLIINKTPREDALRFCLQCIITMFAEDVGLLPDHIFTRLVNDCIEDSALSYDLIGGLFQEMNREGITPAGRYEGVDYFNGGLFNVVKPIKLNSNHIQYLQNAAEKNWRNVNPAIFGTIFEQGLDTTERHILGAHYTHEIDIKKVVDPCIVQPWNNRIDSAESTDDCYELLTELVDYKVLDPACGSGNFLFVAFKELKLLEKKLLSKIRNLTANDKTELRRLSAFLLDYPYVNTQQFYGIDTNPFAVELAKVTLMVAKELAWLDRADDFDTKFKALPLDNLDQNIACADALLLPNGNPRTWPPANVIVGNPPYQSSNKMQSEFGKTYVDNLRKAYPEVSGRADFCVYWFYKAHLHLPPNGFAGLIATNTICQTYSRMSGLDYIVANEGAIFNAVASQEWAGEAAVYVSVVNWKKGKYDGDKILFVADEKGVIQSYTIAEINTSLTLNTDTSQAKTLKVSKPKMCFQGQMQGAIGFLVSIDEGNKLIKKSTKNSERLYPFLNGDDLLANKNSQPSRFSIDFSFDNDIIAVSKYPDLLKILEAKVLPKVENDAKAEADGLIRAEGRKQQLEKWWQFTRKRGELLQAIKPLKRYIACSQVTKRPIFELISTEIKPNNAVIVFAFDDYYTFGIIQSIYHWQWFKTNCSTLKGDSRYTINTVWDTFPFPQGVDIEVIRRVGAAARALHLGRSQMLRDNALSLRELYRTLDKPGRNPLRDLHTALDEAVATAYQIKPDNVLGGLLALNLAVAEREANGEAVTAPGLPPCVSDATEFVSDDCVEWLG
jgi:SAM-dependent methyltransferase